MTGPRTTIDGVSFLVWVAVGRHGCQWCAYLASTGLLRTATEPTAGEALAAAAAFLAGAGHGSRPRRRPASRRSPLGGAP